MTVLEPDELLVEIEVPPLPDGAGTGFAEHARTHGDFAIAGAAVVRGGREHAAIALLGAGPTPQRATDAETALREGASAAEAAELAGALHDDDHRRALATALVREAIQEAGAMRIAVEINGAGHEGEVEPRTLLSDFIRHDAGLTGTHVGCEHGVCGACTVQLDGRDRALVPDARRAGRRPLAADGRGPGRRGRAAPAPAGLPRGPRAAVRLLHAGLPDVRRGARCATVPTPASARSARRSPATCADARATRGSSRRCRRSRASAARPSRAQRRPTGTSRRSGSGSGRRRA